MQAQLAHQMALAPTGDIMIACAGAAVVLGALAFFFGALLSIVRSDLTGGMKLVWVVFALMAPFFGCLLWFLVGRRDAQRRAGIA
ncbi:PLD nuclease N-terminal domain-containing protein [Streptomyces inhibens]|uniref:PLD nuclease N-terminal domain-containing protein n=1 Tax=Streptomyces inhibens TaxID=2293571 RepID=UPI001EE6AD76|nr:PLD nuclease N-terminal domain-containing protein [Streptomyces inhibens]UKY54817.1 PLD nuclease N-terminal domain-containing protein [Streptomyces inhibens]